MTGLACVKCGLLTLTEPAEVVILDGGLIISGPEMSVREIHEALIDRGLLEGKTPWQVARRLLSEILSPSYPPKK